MKKYAIANGYPIEEFTNIICDECDEEFFELYSDENEQGAFLTCIECEKKHDIENSKQYLEKELYYKCKCNNCFLKIAIGKAFYENSKDIRWVYVGGHCTECNLSGVYVNWNER
jgi:hypothetical protein